jgi:predicted solute-binding protein
MSEETSELAERGEEIFERVVKHHVKDEDDRKYIAIDVESEDFEVDANQRAAANRLLQRHPEAQGRIWFRRVGSRVTHHFGGRLREEGEE